MNIKIVSIKRRQRAPIPGIEPAVSFEYQGSGSVIDHADWHATVRLSLQGFDQARASLLSGEAYVLALHEEDLLSLSIGAASLDAEAQRIAMEAQARLRDKQKQASSSRA